MCGEESTVCRRAAATPDPEIGEARSPRTGEEHASSQPDWSRFVARLMQNDPAAYAKITGVITAVISHMGAFQLRESWADIAQDVLMAVVANVRRGALRDPNAFLAYTRTITRRRVLRWLERHGRAPTLLDPLELAATQEESAPDPELCVDLERALDELPKECRCVIEEIYIGGRTYEETALKLGLSFRQVKRFQSRALSLLRASLGRSRRVD